ncbi:hypothetical protein [Streptomyces sp. NPDC005322]|uniref:hypothetical protein n=1 Tax=Streptomyces sp. NPDC005322 TaxID=3157032 RepID=UPI0033A4CD1D
MGRRRDGDSHIRRATVRGTAHSGLWRAVLLLVAALWMAPLCVHAVADHASAASMRCPQRLAGTEPDAVPGAHPPYASPPYASPPYASPAYASPPYASPAYASPPYGSPAYASPARTDEHDSDGTGGTGGGDCATGPGGGDQALVPTPVPPPALADVAPPDGTRAPDSVRAPPVPAVRALGLHELQVLRT